MIDTRPSLIGHIGALIGLAGLSMTLVASSGCASDDSAAGGSDAAGREEPVVLLPLIEDPFADEPTESEVFGESNGAGDATRAEIEPGVAAGATAPPPGEGRFAVVLGTFSAGDHYATAESLRQEFLRVSSMPHAWIEAASERSIVRYGRYSSYSNPQARSDLERIKNLRVGEQRLFARAFLAPFDSGSSLASGSASAYNLVRLWDHFPKARTLYTLQIAVFQSDPASEARRAAEQLVAQLRAEGEEAYFYHGSSYSHVTIGVFFADAIDPETGILSPEVLATRQRFPFNALNGREIIETRTLQSGDQRQVKQESFLVPVPRE